MSSPTEAPSGSPEAAPLPLTSPAPTSSQDSPPAPPPPPPSLSSPPPSSASAPSPASISSPAPPPPPSSATGRSPPPPPPPSKTTHSQPPPPAKTTFAPPPPPPKITHSPSPPPPPPPHISSSPPPPASKSSPSTTASSSSSSTSSASPPSSSQNTISGGSLIAIGIAGVLAVSVLAVLCYCLCRKKKRYYPGDYYNPHGGPPPHYKDPYYSANMRQQQEWCSPSSDMLIKIPPLTAPSKGYDPVPPPPKGGGSPGLGNSKSWFTYQELAVATGGFAGTNALGEGGFGCVYKGTLSSGQLVAVKQLKAGASQGEKEFRAEVEIISRVHHRHLVSLVGYCIADSQRLLVYDYVNNGTLEYHLHNSKEGPVLDWPTRLKIACGAARGLAYLHEDCHPRIIHRDIKSSNILLDGNFEAQVSDFGLAKLTSDTNTHVTTRVMGTFGYLAPEYASSGKLTEKSDVFSFGVVLLELSTGRKPVDPSQAAGEESLVEWARPVLAQINSEEDLREVADPSLDGAFDAKEMMRMLEAAAACVRHSANKRPRMGQVVRALEDESSLSDLNKGFKPGHSGLFGSSATTEYENGSYSADMRKYMRVALETQEFGSECSGATSEYGLNASVSSGEYHTSKELDRNFSQQCPKPMSMQKNVLSYDTQEFRMGS